MAELKTKPTGSDVDSFLNSVENQKRKDDSFVVLEMMKKITGESPVMWGPSIVGFGSYHYKYESGREGDFFIVGFSPRKAALTIYLMTGFDRYDELMSQLGKFKTGKSCLYIKKLEDVDVSVLERLILESYSHFNS